MIPARMLRAINEGNIAAVVMAAGNSNQECQEELGRPNPSSIICINSTPGNVTVGALTRSGQPQHYTSRGPGQCFPLAPFVAAPTYGMLPWGRGYIDTGLLGGGTSSTTPMVSGAMALLMEAFPQTSSLELKVAIAASARRTIPRDAGYPVPYDRATGFGMIQVGKAVGRVGHPGDLALRQFILEEFQRAPEGGQVVSPVVKPS